MIVVGISAVVILREMRDIEQAIGVDEAESLALQLVNGGFSKQKVEDRQPSSIKNSNAESLSEGGLFRVVGEIGRDPWGEAFQYRVLRDASGERKFVVVWSKGPNRERETQGDQLTLDKGLSVADLEFHGDDFGYLHPIR